MASNGAVNICDIPKAINPHSHNTGAANIILRFHVGTASLAQ